MIGDFVKDRNFLFVIGRLSRFDNVGLIGERGVNHAVWLLNSGSENRFLGPADSNRGHKEWRYRISQLDESRFEPKNASGYVWQRHGVYRPAKLETGPGVSRLP